MTRRARMGLGLLVSLAVFAGVLAAEDVTLKGSFVWERNDDNRDGEVTAVFTPTGDTEWAVAFHFNWEDEPHTYKGTATGSLSSGELKGAVEADGDNHKMSFRFSGSFEDGLFTGTHSFVDKSGGLKHSGTLTLKP